MKKSGSLPVKKTPSAPPDLDAFIQKQENALIFLRSDMPYEAWEMLGGLLSREIKGIQWWIGDWLNYGEKAYGEKYAQALDNNFYSYGVLRNIASVANRIPPAERDPKIPFEIYRIIVSLDKKDQAKFLDRVRKESLSVRDIRIMVDSFKTSTDPEYKSNRLKIKACTAFDWWLVFIDTNHVEDEIVKVVQPFVDKIWNAAQEEERRIQQLMNKK